MSLSCTTKLPFIKPDLGWWRTRTIPTCARPHKHLSRRPNKQVISIQLMSGRMRLRSTWSFMFCSNTPPQQQQAMSSRHRQQARGGKHNGKNIACGVSTSGIMREIERHASAASWLLLLWRRWGGKNTHPALSDHWRISLRDNACKNDE